MDVARVFLLIHNSAATPSCHVPTLFKQMQAAFSARHTKMITLNYALTPNLHQPDMWSRWMNPLYFPESTPKHFRGRNHSADAVVDGGEVLGAYLSMDDFLLLRGFCVNLFQEVDIIIITEP